MCGSGTITIEAAMMAYNIPPGIYRKSFAFEKWADFDKDLFESIYNEEYEEPLVFPNITGSDISPFAITMARSNAKNAFLAKRINFTISSFEDMLPAGEGGFLIANPPYGERLKRIICGLFILLLGIVSKIISRDILPGYLQVIWRLPEIYRTPT
jgi:putative N6-adenine-specific DNA methylase